MSQILTYANVDNVTLERDTAGNLKIKDSGVSTDKIADGAVTDVKHSTDLITKVGTDITVAINTNIEAETDGILNVTAFRQLGGGANADDDLRILSDANNPPTTVKATNRNVESGENEQGSFTLSAVIKAGDFYRLDGDAGTFNIVQSLFTPLRG